MFIFDAERKEIAEVKERIAEERAQLAADSQALTPVARRAAAAGSIVWTGRKLLPILRPVLLGLIQRGVAKRGKRGMLKMLCLAGAGFALWRLFGSGGDADGGEG